MKGMGNELRSMSDQQIFALTTDQGTAMKETALCAGCYPVVANQGYSEDCASQTDDWDCAGWTDCTGNDALECVTCPEPEEA